MVAIQALHSPPEARTEPLSPFVPWTAEDRAPLSGDLGGHRPPSLIVEILREPERLAAGILDQARVQSIVLAALGLVAGSGATLAAIVAAARGTGSAFRSAPLVVGDTLLAVAASIGPIYAVGVLVAARIPLSRLVPTLLAAVAMGALLQAGLGPVVYVLWKLDPLWAGPLSLVGAFLVSSLSSGVRIRRLLTILAEEISLAGGAALGPGDRFRVGIVSRMAMVFLAFTTALGLWAFDAFLA
jgi:hypothetical protein